MCEDTYYDSNRMNICENIVFMFCDDTKIAVCLLRGSRFMVGEAIAANRRSRSTSSNTHTSYICRLIYFEVCDEHYLSYVPCVVHDDIFNVGDNIQSD